MTFCVACIEPNYVKTGKQISNRSGMQFLLAVPSNELCPFQEKYEVFDFQVMSMIKMKDY